MLTEKQLQQRRLSIGGSDAAAVAGFSKWRTPYQVWLEKVKGEYPVFTDEQQDRMNWGHALEEPVIKRYEEVTGDSVIRGMKTIYHKEYKFISANLDGFCEKTNTVIEAKTSQRYDGWGDAGTDQIPADYLFQVAHYCMLKEADEAHIAVLFQGSDFRLYRYIRNKELEKILIKKYVAFWDHNVQNAIEPELINSDDTGLCYQKTNGRSKVADEEVIKNHHRLKEIKEEKKQLKKEEDALKFTQQCFMGHASQVTDASGFPMHTWNGSEREKVQAKLLKENHPEIYNEVIETKLTRTFLTK